MHDISQILQFTYSDYLSTYDIQVFAHFFRLKYGGIYLKCPNIPLDELNIVMIESEHTKAMELVAYKQYAAVHCLNALNLSLYGFVKR